MLNLLMKRRSIRKYEDKAIERGLLDRILQGALTSPSGKNRRPWELIVVEDKEQLKKLGDSRGASSAPLLRAPLALVVISDPKIGDTYIEDCSIMAVVIQLLAEAEGLGSCWIHARNRMTPWDEKVEDYIKRNLDIPKDYAVECMIALGHPDEVKEPHKIDKLPYEKIHYEKYK